MYELLSVIATDELSERIALVDSSVTLTQIVLVVVCLLIVAMGLCFLNDLRKLNRKLTHTEHAVTGLLRMQGQEPDRN